MSKDMRNRDPSGGETKSSFAKPDQGLLSEAGFDGQPMAMPYRTEMEARFGMDLSHLQVFHGNQAAMSALEANAFATGDLIAFDSPNPGQEQVAEEIAHAIQQSRAQGQGISDPNASSEYAAARGLALGTGADASLHRDAVTSPSRAADLVELIVTDGVEYTLVEADMVGEEDEIWEVIARRHGMRDADLIRFNQHVLTVAEGDAETIESDAPRLLAGVTIYIPSSDELVFGECRERGGTMEEATRLYGELAQGSNLQVMAAARMRASGRRGEGYGNRGLTDSEDSAGPFLTPNAELNGASQRRSEVIDGQREYQVNWNASSKGFWKCSLFLHDVLFQAGYQPHMLSNDHYQLAGRLHESDAVTEIPVEQAGPGTLWQRFGGRGADDSHNAILTSFVTVEPTANEEYEEWSFRILGAEEEGAGESERSHTMVKGTNETVTGSRVIRFFKPSSS